VLRRVDPEDQAVLLAPGAVVPLRAAQHRLVGEAVRGGGEYFGDLGGRPGPELGASHSASVRCSSMGSRSFRSGIGRAYVATNVTARGAPRRSGGADGAPERARRHDALRRGGHRPGGATAQSHGHRLGHLLVTAGVGTSEDGTSAQLSGDALAFRAAGEVDDDWIERFTLLAGPPPGLRRSGGRVRCAVRFSGPAVAPRHARPGLASRKREHVLVCVPGEGTTWRL